MKAYAVKSGSYVTAILADEYAHDNNVFYVWPNTNIPILNHQALANHPEKDRIEHLIETAQEGDEASFQKLWGDPLILRLAWGKVHAI